MEVAGELDVSGQDHTPAEIAELLKDYGHHPAVKAWVYYQAAPASVALRDKADPQLIRDLHNPGKLGADPALRQQIIDALQAAR